ncbi:phosphatidylinositol transfer protein CSR1 [Thecamonas trahens ATCC 50062]|uniref:Phosphatidylinositol transfer protein CSR1 n=1 Tax=Thecamonas trahens ATCC 50062 TaxID=461836 RepID=A0A0L0DHW6_THETB|nr:phosphatidylinositol transfer protein CSR1 [Thecamonas trahens ATCC 50062]KNC50893.1 phosphatidylinositol transfer protein CSR1 [Thecamonas trahens ATCC 50062]|eukprot:XP_013756599.1 phosphatidylinositol transfer protein CSR1 [Thecamonas trahens ATCC 50062]
MYPPVSQFAVIVDFTGSSMKNYDTAMLRGVLQVLQTSYPERLGKMWMVNAPWVFSGVWRLVKGMLDKRTVSKIEFVGSDYKDVLAAHFAPECLLASMGGSSQYVFDPVVSPLGVLFPLPESVAANLTLDDDLLSADHFGEAAESELWTDDDLAAQRSPTAFLSMSDDDDAGATAGDAGGDDDDDDDEFFSGTGDYVPHDEL